MRAGCSVANFTCKGAAPVDGAHNVVMAGGAGVGVCKLLKRIAQQPRAMR